ncbi:thioredoxin family protein [Mycobacterium sp.]|uniref:TlpA family protein disulfide reductase n=1 Tax=Mycobacterium sp. TaxID=1785 RepID=UPI002BE0D2A2|nr:thioredoxin family protein [Mycobacterium sp.]HME47134.1 thioredoxin family protein [Mycobacterium sp.]
MSVSLIVALAVVAAALAVAAVIGTVVRRRSGVLRQVSNRIELDTTDLGLSGTGPTVVHFSAVWCGPCAAVRRVVNQVCGELDGVAHVEIDMDIDPAAARRLSVLSLPTTFIFDADGRQRYRTAGVPRAADLRAALQPLLASPHPD